MRPALRMLFIVFLLLLFSLVKIPVRCRRRSSFNNSNDSRHRKQNKDGHERDDIGDKHPML